MEALRNQAPWDAFMAALAPFVAEQIRCAVEAEREEIERLRGTIGTLRTTAVNMRDMIDQQGRGAQDVIGMIHRQIAIAGEALEAREEL